MNLASWLHARAVSVEAVYFEDPDPLVGELRLQGVPVRRLRLVPFVWRLYPWRLIRHLAGRDDVVLHGHMYAWHKGTAVARWREAACVYTQHGYDEGSMRKERSEMKRSAKATEAAVGVSHEVHRLDRKSVV